MRSTGLTKKKFNQIGLKIMKGTYNSLKKYAFQNDLLGAFGDTTWHAQPILPILADFFACVPPALQKRPTDHFEIGIFLKLIYVPFII